MAASIIAVDSSIDTLRAAAETAASAAKTKANSALFQDHLSQARAQTNERPASLESAKIERPRSAAKAADDTPPSDESSGSDSAGAAKHAHRHHATKTASSDQSSSPTDETVADPLTPLPIAPGQTDPLALLLSLSGTKASVTDGTTAEPTEEGSAEGSGSAAVSAEAPQAADQPTASDAKAAAAGSNPALAAETQAASQTQPADNGKLFIFVRPAPNAAATDPKTAAAPAAKPGKSEAIQSDLGQSDLGQSKSAASASAPQQIKVVVQPRTPVVAVQPASDSAIAAQQEPVEAAAQTSSAPPPLSDQAVNVSPETGSETSSGQNTLGALGITALSDSGHKGQSSSDDKDDLLNDGSSAAALSTQAKAETSNNGSTGFAALVAGTGNAAQASPVATTADTNNARAPQVPPPPAEQLAFGLSRLTNGANSFSMQLDPERLGSVSVQLEVDAKGKAKATFSAERPETLALMRQDSHHLLKALQDAGVKTDQASLNFSLKDQPGTASQERRPSFGSSGSSRANSFSSSEPVSTGGDAPPPVDSSRLYDLHA